MCVVDKNVWLPAGLDIHKKLIAFVLPRQLRRNKPWTYGSSRDLHHIIFLLVYNICEFTIMSAPTWWTDALLDEFGTLIHSLFCY